MSLWVVDPKTSKKSVTLTFAVISFVFLIGVAMAKVLGHADTIGPFLEMFITSVLLYLGRRANIKTSNLTINQEGKDVN